MTFDTRFALCLAVTMYWLMGCVVIGFGASAFIAKCPRDDISSLELLQGVVMWPVVEIAGVFSNGEECKRLP